jgi:hypothetical protein
VKKRDADIGDVVAAIAVVLAMLTGCIAWIVMLVKA